MLKNDEFQLRNVVWVNPVFCCVTNKVGLTSTSSTVSFDWVPSCPYNIVELRELDNVGIVVVGEEGLRF